MKIEKARATAMLMFLLHRFKIIDPKRYDKLINLISIRTLKTQMEDKLNAEPNQN